MCFAKTNLMVALQKGYVKNEGQRFGIAMQGVCVRSYNAIGRTAPEISW